MLRRQGTEAPGHSDAQALGPKGTETLRYPRACRLQAGRCGENGQPGVPTHALRAVRAALGRADDLRLSLYDQLPALLKARSPRNSAPAQPLPPAYMAAVLLLPSTGWHQIPGWRGVHRLPLANADPV